MELRVRSSVLRVCLLGAPLQTGSTCAYVELRATPNLPEKKSENGDVSVVVFLMQTLACPLTTTALRGRDVAGSR